MAGRYKDSVYQDSVACSMLVVEDDAVAREVLRTALERRYPRLRLHEAASGGEGLRLFRELHPAIVMTDIQMPGMNGVEMAQLLRNLDPQAQIIVITAHNDLSFLLDCINIEVNRFLLKPVASELLFEAVDDCLERIALEQKLQAQHQALVRSGEQLRLALESAALGTWDLDPDRGTLCWDERCRAMFGIQSADCVDFRVALGRVHPEDRSRLESAVREAAAGGYAGGYRQEFRVVWPDGSVHWIASHGKGYSGPEGGRRCIGSHVDITDRVRATEQLLESESRYRGLFNSLQEGFSLLEAVIGPDGVEYRFLEVNPAFERLTGLSRGELVGSSLARVFPELEARWVDCLDRVTSTGRPFLLEHHAPEADRYYEVQVYSPAKGQLAALYSDVSERRKLQMEREKNERLESLGVLAGGIAHDFNNILMAIAGNISLARMQLEGDPAVDARLEDSEKAVAKAAGLTRQLLTFARGGEPVKKSLNAAALICEAASLFLSGGNCKAELSLPDDLWSLQADAGQIHQALNNLILNAVQSMPEGGTLRIGAANHEVGVTEGRGLDPGRYLRITIEDQGCGIPTELLTRIFDPYFTTKETGSGLGLASVFSIVKRHEGAIGVVSAPGSGTSFELLLPASEQRAEERGEALPETPGPGAQGAEGLAVLVMDDEEMIRKLAALMLARLGYRPTVCCDGAEAVELYRDSLARKEQFAVVILDMTVPGGMGGKEAARRIRALDQDAVLVISSGYSSDPLVDQGLELQANGLVAKPYNLKQLSDELSRVLARA